MQRASVQGLNLSFPRAQVQLSFAKRQALGGSAGRLGTVVLQEKAQSCREIQKKKPTSNCDAYSCWKELPEQGRGRYRKPSLSRATQAARRAAGCNR